MSSSGPGHRRQAGRRSRTSKLVVVRHELSTGGMRNYGADMRPAFRTVRRSAVCCVAAAIALTSATSCTSVPKICAGQCAPPYELQIDFHSGTSAAIAEEILRMCADHNPVVIRVGALKDLPTGWTRALMYTRAFGSTARTAGLLKCLRASDRAYASWPD